MKTEINESTKFLRWIITHAKIQVLSGDAIEVHGINYLKGDDKVGMCPVVSAEELYQLYLKNPNGFSQPEQVKGEER